MDRSQLAIRVSRAIDRIVDGLEAQGAGDEALAAIRAANHKDPDIKRLRVIEAIADAVESAPSGAKAPGDDLPRPPVPHQMSTEPNENGTPAESATPAKPPRTKKPKPEPKG